MKIFDYLLGLPKTLIFNFRYFSPSVAIRFPVIVSNNIRFQKLGGQILLEGEVKPAGIRLGFGNVPIFDKRSDRGVFSNKGTIIFKGRAKLGHGSKIVVAKGAQLALGNRFNMTANSALYCHHKMSFGDYNLLSWDVLVMDSDLHDIYRVDDIKNQAINKPAPVVTGESVWFGCRATVLKGTEIAKNTIIAANANLCGHYREENAIYGGNPAKVIKRHVRWDSAIRDYLPKS